ncbi:MAG: glycosyltransferase family 4 protein [Sphingorhabdus sp.]
MARAKILHLHSTFDLGGKEARTVKLMNHFGDEAEHTLLVGDMAALGARDAIDPGVRVEFPGSAAPSLLGMPALGRYRELARYFRDFDLLLSYNWGAMDGVMAHTLLGGNSQVPALIHHEDGFNEDENEKLSTKRNWFRTIALRRSEALVVPSQTLENIARSHWYQGEGKVVRIPNGIDVAAFQAAPAPDAFPGLQKRKGEILVGTVAGLRAVKNLPRLVRCVAAAGDNITLAIAGEGPARVDIQREADSLGISSRVIMPGFLPEPSHFTGLFDIFALSSDSEQYPISLVEAMAAGCAVVSTDVGDVRNIVAEANRPYIIPRGDEARFSEAIATLAADDGLRKNLGQENARLAHREYQEDAMFNRYRKLYGDAMGRADFARQR